MRKVPFFDYPALAREHGDEVQAAIQDVLARGAYILQKDCVEFEHHLEEFIGVKHAITCANGTDGLIIALRASGILPGDEVIIPSHTYVASAAAVHFTGGIVKLVECGPDHMVDPKAIEAAITPRTRFIMPVHINGRSCQMDQIMALAERYKLKIVEDAAQGLGARFNGQHVGTFGLAGMFSFYPAKVLGCFGDGGLVVTNHDSVATQLRLLRDHGRNEDGRVVTWGLNSRLDNLHAAVLDVKLKHYPETMRRRREVAKIYDEGLSSLKEVKLPPAPDSDPMRYDIYQNYEIEAQRRDELKAYLAEHGVGSIVQWAGHAVHQLSGLGFDDVKLPVTEEMTRHFLMLPMNTFVSNHDVEYVIEKVRQFYGYN